MSPCTDCSPQSAAAASQPACLAIALVCHARHCHMPPPPPAPRPPFARPLARYTPPPIHTHAHAHPPCALLLLLRLLLRLRRRAARRTASTACACVRSRSGALWGTGRAASLRGLWPAGQSRPRDPLWPACTARPLVPARHSTALHCAALRCCVPAWARHGPFTCCLPGVRAWPARVRMATSLSPNKQRSNWPPSLFYPPHPPHPSTPSSPWALPAHAHPPRALSVSPLLTPTLPQPPTPPPRLCRGIQVFGIARIDLMQQAEGGLAVQPHWIHAAQARLSPPPPTQPAAYVTAFGRTP